MQTYKKNKKLIEDTYYELRKIKEKCQSYTELNNPIGKQVLFMLKDLLKLYELEDIEI